VKEEEGAAAGFYTVYFYPQSFIFYAMLQFIKGMSFEQRDSSVIEATFTLFRLDRC
jgi:hypothetical protein